MQGHGCHRQDLQKRIDDLVTKGKLTADNADVLHSTRMFSNTYVHEALEPNVQELSIAMDVIESLLRNVYIVPKKAERLKKKK